jgi:uncharacterized membrane protein
MSAEPGVDTGRLARTMTLIALVTAVFLWVLAERLSGQLLQVGVAAVGAVAVVTAITGFLIAAGAYFDETDRR